MTIFTATTETNAVYTIDTEAGTWSYRGSGRPIDNELLIDFRTGTFNEGETSWNAMNDWEKTDRPVIGERMLLDGLDTWRISTFVTKIEEVE
jgi:hypothetical protein